MADGLKDLNVEIARLWRVEGDSDSHECIGKTVDTDADGTVTHVGVASIDDCIVIHVNDLVHTTTLATSWSFSNSSVEGRERRRRQVADSGLIRRRVLDDLRAKVRRLDRTEVLLIGFA